MKINNLYHLFNYRWYMWFICFIVVEVIMFFVPISRAIAKERGLVRYFTGEPCKRNGIGARRCCDQRCLCEFCIPLLKAAVKRGNENNRESQKAYYQENKDRIKKTHHSWYLLNRDSTLAQKKQYVAENAESVKEWGKRYREENAERLNKKSRDYHEQHRSELLFKASVRSASKIDALPLNFGELDEFVITEAYSLSKLREITTNFKWNVDHMIPLRGRIQQGLHSWDNIQLLPKLINNFKSNHLIYTNPHEWLYDIPKFFKVVYQQEIAA